MITTFDLSAVDDPASETSVLEKLLGVSIESNRSIAKHGNASPDMLRRLAQSPDRITRRNVAANPQTPKEVLLELAPTFAGEFFLNPVFDLLLMEDPNLLDALPVGVMKNILKREDCPISFLNWAARYGNKSHQLALVGRSRIARELLEVVARGPHAKPAEVAAGRLMSGDGEGESASFS